MPRLRFLALAVIAIVASSGVAALDLRSVQVQGLDDEAMLDNVNDALSLQRLNPNRRNGLTESRLSYLLRRTPREVREALEPFGYYDPEVQTTVQRDGELVTVLVQVTPGEPVRVRKRDITMTGPAETDSALMRRLQRFRPREDQPFHHGTYEDSKAMVDSALAERGYFDAALVRHQVTVNRAERSADIDLAWTSGERYAMGAARFEGHQFRPGLLDKLVDWDDGDPFDQTRLVELQTSLAELDYFSAIDISAEPDSAVDGQVPVRVSLAPGKRTIYSAGLRYGTDTGAGVTGSMERRWVNDRGHKFRAQAKVAERENNVAAQYRIPAFAWLDGWYTVGASVREERVEFVDSQIVEVIGSRSGRIGNWDLVAAMNFRRERYEDSISGLDYSYTTLFFPSLWAQWGQSDDLLYPRRARGVTVELSAGSNAIGSDVDFLQARAEGKWIRSFGRRNRLLLRAELGTTVSDQFPEFPPSLRFYAGGDNSVRGYGYKEIGRFIEDANGRRFVFGGKHLMVGSVEYERMFSRQWGGAVFVDAGDAFDSFSQRDVQVGIGVGARWRSPVGPVRIDLAHGLGDAAQQSVRLHVSIGPDL
jgi:translocation and assembly module TamA